MKNVKNWFVILFLLPMGQVMAEGPMAGKVYGKISLAVVEAGNGNTGTTELVNNASRFGLKGKSELEGGVKAIYQLEYEVAVDDGGNGDELKQRNSFVGIETLHGKIVAGIHDTPLKVTQNKVDLFNDLPTGDIKNLVNGEERIKNIVQYTSPKYAGMTAKLMRQFNDEGTEGKNGASASFSYEMDGLYLALASDRTVDDKTANKDVNRLVAQYKLGNLQVGFLFNDSKSTGSSVKADSGSLVSLAYKTGRLVWKFQAGSSDEKSAGKKLTALGADYRFAKTTKAYFYYAATEDDKQAKVIASGIGMEHKF